MSNGEQLDRLLGPGGGATKLSTASHLAAVREGAAVAVGADGAAGDALAQLGLELGLPLLRLRPGGGPGGVSAMLLRMVTPPGPGDEPGS